LPVQELPLYAGFLRFGSENELKMAVFGPKTGNAVAGSKKRIFYMLWQQG